MRLCHFLCFLVAPEAPDCVVRCSATPSCISTRRLPAAGIALWPMIFALTLLLIMVGTATYLYVVMPGPVDIDSVPCPCPRDRDPWERSIDGIKFFIRAMFLLVSYEALRQVERRCRLRKRKEEAKAPPGVTIDVIEPAK
jgi:hypothetical protein